MENNVDEKIKYLIGKMNNLNGIEDVQEINKILQEGITIDKILEEISTKQYDEYIEHKGLESLSDIILVHKTYYAPQNNTIKTSENAGATVEHDFTFEGKEYNYLTPSHRQTIHFSMNGEVTANDGGNFTGRKYAILIPFENIDKEQLGSAYPVDTFLDGDVRIQPGGYILCPEVEREKVGKQNPNLIVLGYEKESVDEYGDKLLEQVLGYKKEGIGHMTLRNESDEKKIYDILNKTNIKQHGPHGGTPEFEQEKTKNIIDVVLSMIKITKDEIVSQDAYEKLMELLRNKVVQSTFINGGSRSIIEYMFDETKIPKGYLKEQILEQLRN